MKNGPAWSCSGLEKNAYFNLRYEETSSKPSSPPQSDL